MSQPGDLTGDRREAYPEESVDLLVVWCNPGNKGKRAETCPDVVWEPVCNKGEGCHVGEETVAAYQPAISWFPRLWLM